MDDTYNYEQDLQDDVDTLDFGKYKGLTPAEILKADPGYIAWVWNNTPRWTGSEELVKRAFREAEMEFHARNTFPRQHSELNKSQQADACNNAIFETFGVFPKPLWMR